jgi:hypothetical protein
MRSREEMQEVRLLMERGMADPEVSRRAGVPATTVNRWRRGTTRTFGPAPVPAPWRPPDAFSYAYLLGVYLGDGCVSVSSRGRVLLRIALDSRYPEIVIDCHTAVQLVLPSSTCRVYPRPGVNMVNVQSPGKRWLDAFPQHGPGRKHEWRIELVSWQREIVDRFPKLFLRGLIHSDGCRTVNRFKTKLPSGRVAEYAYVRYFFSNLSPDIRGLFCEYCDRLGIRWTLSNPRNVSVSHRASVALLDEFVGPKA